MAWYEVVIGAMAMVCCFIGIPLGLVGIVLILAQNHPEGPE